MNLEPPKTLLEKFDQLEPFTERLNRICDKYSMTGQVAPDDFNYFVDRFTAYRRTLQWVAKEVSSREIPQELKYVVCQAAAETVLSDK